MIHDKKSSAAAAGSGAAFAFIEVNNSPAFEGYGHHHKIKNKSVQFIEQMSALKTAGSDNFGGKVVLPHRFPVGESINRFRNMFEGRSDLTFTDNIA